jgi:hypothetical protein
MTMLLNTFLAARGLANNQRARTLFLGFYEKNLSLFNSPIQAPPFKFLQVYISVSSSLTRL